MNAIVTSSSATPATPAAADAALKERLKATCGVKLAERPVVLPGQPELIATLTPSMESFQSSLELLERAMRPASEDALDRALTAMKLQTASKATGEASEDLQAEIYLARLRQYPADIALKALHDWPSQSKWWPTWRELEEGLERLVRWRRSALAALRFAALEHAPIPEEPKSATVTDGFATLAAKLRGAPKPDAAPRMRPTAEPRSAPTRPPKRTPEQQIAALRAELEGEQS